MQADPNQAAAPTMVHDCRWAFVSALDYCICSAEQLPRFPLCVPGNWELLFCADPPFF